VPTFRLTNSLSPLLGKWDSFSPSFSVAQRLLFQQQQRRELAVATVAPFHVQEAEEKPEEKANVEEVKREGKKKRKKKNASQESNVAAESEVPVVAVQGGQDVLEVHRQYLQVADNLDTRLMK